MKVSVDDSHMRPNTPPRQIRVRSPLVNVDEGTEPGDGVGTVDDIEDEEDIDLMLFTPFKIVGAELPELSPDIELSASIVAGSDTWVSFTPTSAGARLRTSTPCQLLNSPPENDAKHSGGRGDCQRNSRFSSLLVELDASGSSAFDSVTGYENALMCGLPSWNGRSIDEAIEMDITDLTFR